MLFPVDVAPLPTSYVDTQSSSKTRRRVVIAFWVLSFSFYTLTGSGHSNSGDGFLLFLTGRSLLRHGSFAVPPVPWWGRNLVKRGADGGRYAKYGPAMAFAHVPALVIARVAPFKLTVGEAPIAPLRRDEFWGQLTSAWIGATALTFVMLCGAALGYELLPSIVVALLAGVASPFWLYARTDLTEALQAMALVGALHHSIHARTASARGHSPAWSVLGAGAMCGLALGAKVANAILIPWFATYCTLVGVDSRTRVRNLAIFSTPITAIALLLLLYNYVRFDAAFDTGYDLKSETFRHPLLAGAWTLLFSPGYGLLVFWPAAWLVVLAVGDAARTFPRETSVIAGVFFSLILVYARWWAYWGLYWGPRFLIPSIPLLALLLLPLARRIRMRRFFWAFTAAFVSGFAIQSIGVASSFWQQIVPAVTAVAPQAPDLSESRLPPLRVGAWWVGLAFDKQFSTISTFRRELTEPPWHEDLPWRNPELAPERFAPVVGLDLWASPARWRMPYHSSVGPDAGGIPSSRPLALGLLSMTLGAAFVLARDVGSLWASNAGPSGDRGPPATD